MNNDLILLEKDFGEPIAIIKTEQQTGVLILVNRFEKESIYISHPVTAHTYTVIKFERPPELCGVDEPEDIEAHKKLSEELHTKFLKALISACKQNDITNLCCVGIDIPEALPYKEELKASGITLKEYVHQN